MLVFKSETNVSIIFKVYQRVEENLKSVKMKNVLSIVIGCMALALLVESAPSDIAKDSSLSKAVRATINENDLTCENYEEFCNDAADKATAMPSERVVIVNACKSQVNKQLHCT